jgi:hypothetical protein
MLLGNNEPWLSEAVRDALSIVGFIVTVLGLIYAIRQIRLTKSAADAAKEAADKALLESQKSYQRYTAGNAHRFVNEAKIHVEYKAWSLAAFRLNDLADHVAQLAGEDSEWRDLADELRQWEATCQGQARGQKKGFAVAKWAEFTRRLQAKMADWFGPFPAVSQEVRDDN